MSFTCDLCEKSNTPANKQGKKLLKLPVDVQSACNILVNFGFDFKVIERRDFRLCDRHFAKSSVVKDGKGWCLVHSPKLSKNVVKFELSEAPQEVMVASEFEDNDGYKLRFGEKCFEGDKEFFRQRFPQINTIVDERVHCSTCDAHIGTAPMAEKTLRTHLLLSVSQCNKCYAFYHCGEFGKGEDGSEYYCRWCGQGGEVYCCATCPYVFCGKCIKFNFSSAYLKAMMDNDDWQCFVCDKEALKDHRAKHWALRNYIMKQLEKIQATTINSEERLTEVLNKDSSTCCSRLKNKYPYPPSPVVPQKRPASQATYGRPQPPAKRMHPALMGQGNGGIVCTPDIPMFNQSQSMPPLATIQRRFPPPNPGLPTNNSNGYQIDLDRAANQQFVRLPNGKMIQVRKQSLTPRTLAPRMPGGITIRSASSARQQIVAVRQQPNQQSFMQSFRNSRPGGQAFQRAQYSQGSRMNYPMFRNHTPRASAPPKPAAPPSTVFSQQNGTIAVARAQQPDTPFGNAKTAFEDKIISGLEICQHTINKMITLTNASSFKDSRTFSDLQGLHIHLKYLFNYTAEKIKHLQDDIQTSMEKIEVITNAGKEKSSADELEIVEEKADVIEVMSDDEEGTPSPAKPKEAPTATATTAGPASVKRPILKHLLYTEKNDESPMVRIAEPQVELTVDETPIVATVDIDPMISHDSLKKIVEADSKLSEKVLVKVEKIEDSKSKIIKEYMRKIEARVKPAESREGSPDMFQMLMSVDAVLEGENDAESSSTPENGKEKEIEVVQGEKEGTEAVKDASPVEVVDLEDSSDSEPKEKENNAEDPGKSADETENTVEAEKAVESAEVTENPTEVAEADAKDDEITHMDAENQEEPETAVDADDSVVTIDTSTDDVEASEANEEVETSAPTEPEQIENKAEVEDLADVLEPSSNEKNAEEGDVKITEENPADDTATKDFTADDSVQEIGLMDITDDPSEIQPAEAEKSSAGALELSEVADGNFQLELPENEEEFAKCLEAALSGDLPSNGIENVGDLVMEGDKNGQDSLLTDESVMEID